MGTNSERGILTDRDRNYLDDDLSPDSSHERMIQSVIRRRVRAGLEDMSILFKRLPDEEIQKLIDERHDHQIQQAIAFLYRLERHRPSPPGVDFEVQTRAGVQSAASREGRTAAVTVEIEEREADLDRLLDKPREDLTDDEIAYLLRHPDVDISLSRRDS